MNAVTRGPVSVGRRTRRATVIGIADKNPFLARELASYLEGHGDVEVAIFGADTCALACAAATGEIEIAIMGWEMAEGTSADCVKQLRSSGVKVIVYTGCMRSDVPFRALSLGAAGFCSKTDAPEMLLEAIEAVRSGRLSFPYIDMSRLNRDPRWSLTPRERQVLAAVALGSTNAEIASALDISPNTVKFHLKRAYEKIGAANRSQAAAYFLTSGIGH